jgi:aspartyl-tRNA(Asn)/glutamyl-tRNA(Gln) amidotransferase subunit A
MVPFALGSDTGGSVRQPAALSGITGFKPTYGRVSRYGLIAFGSSLDTVGVLAPAAEEVERVLEVISGADERDSTCAARPPFQSVAPREHLRGLRVGLPREYLPATLDSGVRARVEEALDVLRELGAELVPVHLPLTRHAIATYYVVGTAEASSNLSRYDGVRYGPRADGDGSLQGMFAATRAAGFGSEALRRILLGTHVLSSGYYDAWFLRAARVRRKIAGEFERVFGEVDLLAGPTSPEVAFRLGEKSGDPVSMYLCDALTVPTSLAGLPAISAPCGFSKSDGVELPVGLQLIGPAFEDARVLSAARCYQSATGHHRRVPPL